MCELLLTGTRSKFRDNAWKKGKYEGVNLCTQELVLCPSLAVSSLLFSEIRYSTGWSWFDLAQPFLCPSHFPVELLNGAALQQLIRPEVASRELLGTDLPVTGTDPLLLSGLPKALS